MQSNLFFFNWKMNPSSLGEAQKLLDQYNQLDFDPLRTVVFVPSVYLNLVKSKQFELGAQDISQYQKGPYTGQLSGNMLKNIGCQYVLAGHSEIRKHHSINNEGVKNKIERAWETGLIPVLCIAYSNNFFKHNQLKLALDSVLESVNSQNKDLVVAFEPLTNIGSGKAMETIQIQDYINFIRNILNTNNFSKAKLLYGGSVNSTNIKELKTVENLDGFLIGNASLDYLEVKEMLKS